MKGCEFRLVVYYTFAIEQRRISYLLYIYIKDLLDLQCNLLPSSSIRNQNWRQPKGPMIFYIYAFVRVHKQKCQCKEKSFISNTESREHQQRGSSFTTQDKTKQNKMSERGICFLAKAPSYYLFSQNKPLHLGFNDFLPLPLLSKEQISQMVKYQ